jgi:hypothetical protein
VIGVSFGNALKNFGVIQEALVLGLMVVSMFAIFYFDIDVGYKIGIAAIAFAVIILTSIASQLLNLQKEAAKQAQA